MLFLRPKTEESPPAEPAPTSRPPPAVSQPGKAADAAQDAVEAANGQLEPQESVDGVDAGEAAAGTTSPAPRPPSRAPPTARGRRRRRRTSRACPKPVAQGAPQAQGPRARCSRTASRADDQAVAAGAQARSTAGTAACRADRADQKIVQVRPHRPRRRRRAVADVVVADRKLRADDARRLRRRDDDRPGRRGRAAATPTGLVSRPVPARGQRRLRDVTPNALRRDPATSTATSQAATVADRARPTRSASASCADFTALKAPAKWRALQGATVADDELSRGDASPSVLAPAVDANATRHARPRGRRSARAAAKLDAASARQALRRAAPAAAAARSPEPRPRLGARGARFREHLEHPAGRGVRPRRRARRRGRRRRLRRPDPHLAARRRRARRRRRASTPRAAAR